MHQRQKEQPDVTSSGFSGLNEVKVSALMQTPFACGLRRGRLSNRRRFGSHRPEPEEAPQRSGRPQLARLGDYGLAIRQTLRAQKG